MHLKPTAGCQISTLIFGFGGGGPYAYSMKNYLYAQMSIQCVECAITEIYLLLVARNL